MYRVSLTQPRDIEEFSTSPNGLKKRKMIPMLPNNEKSLTSVVMPMVLVLLDAIMRWLFDHYAWQLNSFWIFVEFAMIVGAGWFVIASERSVMHKTAKLLWLVFIYVITRMPNLDIHALLDVEGAFVCFQTAELVLLDRKVITDDARNAVKKYWKDWFMLVLIAIAWFFRSAVMFLFGAESMFVANAMTIAILLLVVAFNMLGDDFWNKVLQGVLAVACLWLLFTGYADYILWYWGLLNFAIKATEIISGINLEKLVDSVIK